MADLPSNATISINHAMKNVTTCEEAIKVKHYIKNECWTNTLNDFYGNEPRMKKMARDKVLDLRGRTDEFKTSRPSIKI